jgi:hypothetical protein
VIASESAQGQDLDHDGDTADAVAHVLDLGTSTLTNTHLALVQSIRGPEDLSPLPQLEGCTDTLAAFLVSEAETGADLDHDGIPDESGTWVFDRRTSTLRALPFGHSSLVIGGDLAAFFEPSSPNGRLHVFDARDGTTFPDEPSALLAVGDGIVAFGRDEAGVSDLNGGGDASDTCVLHFFIAGSGRFVNTSFAVVRSSVAIEDGFVGFVAHESENGGLDLNGDGDGTDPVFVAWTRAPA